MDREPTDIQRVGIILEDMRSQFRAVVENQTGLREELKRDISEKFEFLNDEISVIKKAVTATSKKVNNIERDVADIKSHLPYTQEILSNHEYRIKKLETV